MKYQQWKLPPSNGSAGRRRLEEAGLPPLCAAVLSARGLDTPEQAQRFLAHDSRLFHDPFLLRDMNRAVERIRRGLDGGETIAVYGDYDVDGITTYYSYIPQFPDYYTKSNRSSFSIASYS